MRRQLIAGLALAAAAASAAACRIGPIDPARLTLQAQPVVFVGRVLAVTRETTTFELETPIHGVQPGQRTVVTRNNPPGSCTHAFQPGQRWLYAGDFVPGPSRLLEDASAPRP